MREFGNGVGMLLGGFALWRRRPGLMARGLIPAVVVGAMLLTAIVVLAMFLPAIVTWMTPFAEDWPTVWAVVVRVAAGAAVAGAAVALSVVSFTALTLLVGEPFYDRIWRAVEAELGAADIDADYGFWRAVRDAVTLVLRGIGVAIVAALLGLVPLVGGLLGTLTAVTLTGWLLADELTSRALTARGLDAGERRRLRRAHRARVLGFGVATQLCFMVPFGAIPAMPAAVAGATTLARSLREPAPRD